MLTWRNEIISLHAGLRGSPSRQQIAHFACEVRARISGMLILTKRLKGCSPEAEASISKMVSTELSLSDGEIRDASCSAVRVVGRRSPFAPEGDWLRPILASESMTIAGGTSASSATLLASDTGACQKLNDPEDVGE